MVYDDRQIIEWYKGVKSSSLVVVEQRLKQSLITKELLLKDAMYDTTNSILNSYNKVQELYKELETLIPHITNISAKNVISKKDESEDLKIQDLLNSLAEAGQLLLDHKGYVICVSYPYSIPELSDLIINYMSNDVLPTGSCCSAFNFDTLYDTVVKSIRISLRIAQFVAKFSILIKYRAAINYKITLKPINVSDIVMKCGTQILNLLSQSKIQKAKETENWNNVKILVQEWQDVSNNMCLQEVSS